MARNRMIKAEFWDNERLATQVSRDARLVYIALWNLSDDYGVVKGNHTWLRNHVFPYDDHLTAEEFNMWINELHGRILPFEHDGEQFYYIRNFTEHQTISRPSAQRNPAPPENIIEDYIETHGALMEHSLSHQEIVVLKEKEKEKGKEKDKEKKIVSPKVRPYDSEIVEIVEYLNDKSNRKFNPQAAHTKHIAARLKEGATIDDCKAVIDVKVTEWLGGKMDAYLRPQTLFNAEKFDGYKAQAAKQAKPKYNEDERW